MPRSGIVITRDEITPRLRELWPDLQKGLIASTEYHTDRGISFMRSDAPWTDQTSNARNGLDGKAFHSDSQHVIVFFHQVPYGIWLEVRWAGRYAIIIPTVLSEGRELMKTLNQLLGRIG